MRAVRFLASAFLGAPFRCAASAFVAIATLGALACSSATPSRTEPPPSIDASGPIAATMNDVSVLFPLPSREADIDNLLAPSATGDQGVLLPSALYGSMGSITGSTANTSDTANELAAYADLRVVSMRIDPCFASLAPDPHGVGCQAQIRLVFQEVDWVTGSATAFDSALHAFYDLTRGEFLALAQALVDLRTANANGEASGSLAPHPVMVRQGLGGAMSTGVKRLILQYAGERNLVRLAQLGTQNNELEQMWTMSAFDVGNASAKATPRQIATLAPDAGSTTVEFVGFGHGSESGSGVGSGSGANEPGASFGPTTASDDNFIPLDDGRPEDLSASTRQAAFDALVRVENPRDNSPNTIDCASCHMATPTEKLIAMPLFSLDDTMSPLAFVPDGTVVTTRDMTASFAMSAGQINIHAFSYFGDAPGISQPAVNETAAVVEYLNNLPQ
jgi:hypothetical protein